jgi:hypothetical protein
MQWFCSWAIFSSLASERSVYTGVERPPLIDCSVVVAVPVCGHACFLLHQSYYFWYLLGLYSRLLLLLILV